MAWRTTDIPDLTGKRAVITGATNGIGLEAAKAMAARGAELVLTGRDAARGEAALATVRAEAPNAKASFLLADFSRLMAVRGLAQALTAEGRPIDILLNNAGLVGTPARQITADGFERQFGVNYLAHYALTALLWPLLRAAKAARVVTIASNAHKRGQINFDDLQSAKDYKRMRAYAQSKLANLIFALELDRRLRAANSPVISVAAHPGLAITHIFEATELPFTNILKAVLGKTVGQPQAEGALPGLYAATAEPITPGGYYGPQGLLEMRGPVGNATIAAQAKDQTTATRLFTVSSTLTSIVFPALGGTDSQ